MLVSILHTLFGEGLDIIRVPLQTPTCWCHLSRVYHILTTPDLHTKFKHKLCIALQWKIPYQTTNKNDYNLREGTHSTLYNVTSLSMTLCSCTGFNNSACPLRSIGPSLITQHCITASTIHYSTSTVFII